MPNTLHLYNTATHSKEAFTPLSTSGEVLMYNCGPTVYSRAHIGNLSSYLFADFLRRWLELDNTSHAPYHVRQVKNITDVGHLTQDDWDAGEDKMVAAAKKEGKGVEDIAHRYTALYLQDEESLHILSPAERPRASQYVSEQIAFIEELLASGHAYRKGGNVYFSVASFPRYGSLSGNDLAALQAGARVDVDIDKESPLDFLLWREAAEDHLMQWDSPWGKGYPGWHIECSAMARSLLGEQIDIHTGGEDNIFPHHESEIAQTESITGAPFAQFWLHRKHVLVNGEKMSKSLGNFYTLDDIREHGFHPLDFRFLVFSSHYRSQLDFSWTAMHQARENIQRLLTFRTRLSSLVSDSDCTPASHELTRTFQEQIRTSLNDDMNTPEVLAHLFDFVRTVHRRLDTSSTLDTVLVDASYQLLHWIDGVLGILESYPSATEHLHPSLSDHIRARIQEREDARAQKRFEDADRIREELAREGVILDDTPKGTTWSYTPPTHT